MLAGAHVSGIRTGIRTCTEDDRGSLPYVARHKARSGAASKGTTNERLHDPFRGYSCSVSPVALSNAHPARELAYTSSSRTAAESGR